MLRPAPSPVTQGSAAPLQHAAPCVAQSTHPPMHGCDRSCTWRMLSLKTCQFPQLLALQSCLSGIHLPVLSRGTGLYSVTSPPVGAKPWSGGHGHPSRGGRSSHALPLWTRCRVSRQSPEGVGVQMLLHSELVGGCQVRSCPCDRQLRRLLSILVYLKSQTSLLWWAI